ncbi:MAG: copper resistance protein CopC [Actinobacteria bacterium]|jgi:copper resistance protein C|nr:copper resistance protein CopC [Actinomycetota bacterium]
MMTGPATLAMACGALSVVLLGAPAAAHTDLISVDPADGSRLDRAPRQLVLEFSEEMNPGLSTVTLAVDGGEPTRLELAAGRSPSMLVATVPASQVAEPGETSRWRAAFRVVSADGHPVAGESSFTVLVADIPDGQQASPTPTPQGSDTDTTRSAPEPDEEQGGVPWLLIAIPGAVLGLILLVVVAVRRLLGRDEKQ